MKRLSSGTMLVVVVIALTAAASASTQAAPPTVSSSRLVLGGNVRITATIETPVEVGTALAVTFTVRNVSKQPRKIQLGVGCAANLWLVVHSPTDGSYDTRVPLEGLPGCPYESRIRLRASATVTRSIPDLRIRWSGPLRITPGWDQTALPTLQVAVATPAGQPPDDQTAIADVLADTGGLLDNCRPQAPGVPVTGQIDAPKDSAPPMRARCSIGLRREDGFVDAQVLVLVPPGLRGMNVKRPYEQLPWFELGKSGGTRNAEAIGWLFVVTSGGATSVDSTNVETTKRGKTPGKPMAPDWQWTTSGYQSQPGSESCGGTGGGGGGYTGPLVEFVSACG